MGGILSPADYGHLVAMATQHSHSFFCLSIECLKKIWYRKNRDILLSLHKSRPSEVSERSGAFLSSLLGIRPLLRTPYDPRSRSSRRIDRPARAAAASSRNISMRRRTKGVRRVRSAPAAPPGLGSLGAPAAGPGLRSGPHRGERKADARIRSAHSRGTHRGPNWLWSERRRVARGVGQGSRPGSPASTTSRSIELPRSYQISSQSGRPSFSLAPGGCRRVAPPCPVGELGPSRSGSSTEPIENLTNSTGTSRGRASPARSLQAEHLIGRIRTYRPSTRRARG
jgi:hypothetical protein